MKFRRPLTITSRTSSITNSFVQTLVPLLMPSEQEREQALGILGMTEDKLSCVYCGAQTTDWDHLRPLVREKLPTGYISEIRNLVPSCGLCNQSKGGTDWRAWMEGGARGSPKTRGVPDLAARIARLEAFEKWGNAEPYRFEEMVSKEDWKQHWANLAAIEEKMREAQSHAERLREAIQRHFEKSREKA